MRVRRSVALSEAGARKTNTDAVLEEQDLRLFAVADATSGDDLATRALALLRERGAALKDHATALAKDDSTGVRLAVGAFLEGAFGEIDAALRADAEGPTRGVSLAAIALLDRYAYVAHIGDTRAYLLRAGELRCLTTDHTVAMMQLERGQIPFADYLTSPFRHTLSRALGMSPAPQVDVAEVRLASGDLLFLCSNGVTRVTDADRLASLLSEGDPERSATRLMDWVYRAGAPDNASFVIVEVSAEEATRPMAPGVLECVRGSALFRDLSEPQWRSVMPYLEEQQAPEGTVLYHEGDAPDGAWLVGAGEVRLSSQLGVRRVQAGEMFGELGLALDDERLETATAADGGAHLFGLGREQLDRLQKFRPEVGGRLTRELLRQVGATLRAQRVRLQALVRP